VCLPLPLLLPEASALLSMWINLHILELCPHRTITHVFFHLTSFIEDNCFEIFSVTIWVNSSFFLPTEQHPTASLKEQGASSPVGYVTMSLGFSLDKANVSICIDRALFSLGKYE
jgi:hypothetical protein